jgi:methylphosphotriester-DNA--protein-cysteine methyltransferase
MPLSYEQFSPAGELHRWVECYWRLTGEAGLAPHPQRILPDGYVEIILHLGDPFLRVDEGTPAARQARTLFAGQMIRPVRVVATGRTCVWGIRLHPWAAAAVAGVPASELTDRIEDAEAVCPRLVKAMTRGLSDAIDAVAAVDAIDAMDGDEDRAAERCVRALDRILMRHLMRAAPIDPLVMAAGRLLLRAPRPIADVARRMGVSPRHLTRTFRHAVGLTPKMFARISRFQRVAAVLDDDGPGGEVLAGVALACGYYDQSHLVRDVRAFAGGTPVALRAALDGELAEYFLRARRASHFSKIEPAALD